MAMATRDATRTDTGTLRDLLAAPGPFASVYFDREARPERAEEAGARWRDLAARLAREGADAATVDALTTRVMDSLPGTGVLAAFAAGGEVRHVAELPGGHHGDLAEVAPVPHLLPLLEWRQEHPAHVVAVVDRTGADLLIYAEGSTEPRRRTVTGTDDEIVRSSGLPQMRFQHRAEDSWEHNAKAVAEALDGALAEVSATLLLVAGDVRARQYLTKHLPARVRRDVTVGHISGSRGADGPAGVRASRTETEVSRAGHARTAELLRQLEHELAPGGHAVEGVNATLDALAVGRVGTLTVTDDPRDQRTAWFGSTPAELAERREDLPPDGGGEPYEGRLADVAVRAALLTGADVRVLEPGEPRTPAQGTGGICRYP
ncbi:Vms1/Ankzf1 family peptidyl-tRNA hydrolase [Streptomyces sp. I05A-00742]|uniref:baeRF2 domain-containing protein n=1 Tax=Streptomyces sp. I05A-00742 TaxID=2732853 RepID=UPI001488E53A|nr:Vms1/Ankzf1 family peptidyl-tRNA hydrolase [Streptomyces sp. I05A-00742]